jgi:hypothetical protein
MWKSLSALLYTAVGVVVRAAPIHGDSADWAGALGSATKLDSIQCTPVRFESSSQRSFLDDEEDSHFSVALFKTDIPPHLSCPQKSVFFLDFLKH